MAFGTPPDWLILMEATAQQIRILSWISVYLVHVYLSIIFIYSFDALEIRLTVYLIRNLIQQTSVLCQEVTVQQALETVRLATGWSPASTRHYRDKNTRRNIVTHTNHVQYNQHSSEGGCILNINYI